MCRYSWPGNVPGIENVVIKAALSADNDGIEYFDLPEGIQSSGICAGAVGRTLEQLERQAILVALSETRGEKAGLRRRVLGISTRTLMRVKIYKSQDEGSESTPAMAS